MNTQKRKAALKAAALKRLTDLPELLPVPHCGDLELFVRRDLAGDVSARYIQTKETVERLKDDGYTDERWFAADVFDADGQPYFDLTSADDMQLVRLLPAGIKNAVLLELGRANGGDALKNLLAAEKSS